MTASVSLGVGGAWKNVPSLFVGVAGVWKVVNNAYVGIGGAWKLAYVSLAASISGGGVGTRSGAGYATTPIDTVVTVVGGVGAITYAWSRVSGDVRVNATVPNGTPTRFTALMNSSGDNAAATFACIVTDSVGNEVTTNTHGVNLIAF